MVAHFIAAVVVAVLVLLEHLHQELVLAVMVAQELRTL
jgi:hypothetical protein